MLQLWQGRKVVMVTSGLAVGIVVAGLAMMQQIAASRAPYIQEVVLDHDIRSVWKALTRKSLVDRYYLAPLGADIAGIGTEIYYGTAKDKLITGTVIAHQAPSLLSHTFRFVGDTESPDTIVTYRLTTEGKGTRLLLQHRGYRVPSQGHADISGGWPVIIDRLRAVLDGKT